MSTVKPSAEWVASIGRAFDASETEALRSVAHLTLIELISCTRTLVKPVVADMDRVHMSTKEEGAEGMIVVDGLSQGAGQVQINLLLEKASTLHA